MVFTINSVIVGLALLCVCTAEEENHDHSVQTVDPYHEILHFLGISTENEFTIERLNFLVEEYFELLHCHVHDHGHDDEDDDHEESCNKTLVSCCFFLFIYVIVIPWLVRLYVKIIHEL